jgi:hypothetical protein
MAKFHVIKLAAFPLALTASVLVAMACSGGEEKAADSNPGSDAAPGLSVTLYASPT